jgi:hypothetical protein
LKAIFEPPLVVWVIFGDHHLEAVLRAATTDHDAPVIDVSVDPVPPESAVKSAARILQSG